MIAYNETTQGDGGEERGRGGGGRIRRWVRDDRSYPRITPHENTLPALTESEALKIISGVPQRFISQSDPKSNLTMRLIYCYSIQDWGLNWKQTSSLKRP